MRHAGADVIKAVGPQARGIRLFPGSVGAAWVFRKGVDG